MSAEDRILEVLDVEGVGWSGGITSFELAEGLDINIGTVRNVLRQLCLERKAYPCAPGKYARADGKTGMTFVWFRGTFDKF